LIHPNATNYWHIIAAGQVLARCAGLAEWDPLLSGPVRVFLARQYADRAMVAIRRAVTVAPGDSAVLAYLTARTSGFDPLRSRPDFQLLLDELRERVARTAPPPREVKR
jgi:hypothetical protein